MIRYLGRRYNLLMTCIARDGPFACTDVWAPPRTMLSLAQDGYLDIVGGHGKRTPYMYEVPERIRQYYAREGLMNEDNFFDIYLALLRKFGAVRVKIAEQEVQRRDQEAI